VEAFSFSGDFTMEVSDQTDVTATHQELPVNTCAVRGGAIRFSARRPQHPRIEPIPPPPPVSQ
jgi:hypothetical protein